MPNFNIPTDPGDERPALVEGKLRGNGRHEGDSNFDLLFGPYSFKGRTIYGTKADTVNLAGFLGKLSERHGLSEDVEEAIVSRSYGAPDKSLVDHMGMFRAFWSNTSEVHHRDIMRFAYDGLRNALKDVMGDLEDIAARTDTEHEGSSENAEAMFEAAMKLEEVTLDMGQALKELYAIKVGGMHAGINMGQTAKDMLYFSQGYQLSSVPKNSEVDLSKARLLQADLYSAITKTQIRQNLIPSPEEVHRGLQHFLAGFDGVSFSKIRSIHVPETHPTTETRYQTTSYTHHDRNPKRGGGEINHANPQILYVKYYNMNDAKAFFDTTLPR